MKLFNAIDDLLDDVLIYNKKETYRFYLSHCNMIKLYYGNIDINSFDEAKIKDFILYQKNKNLTNNTINKRLLILKKLLKKYNIFIEIPKLKVIEKNFDYLNYYQVKKLLNYISNSKLKLQNKLIFRLFLDSGCRLDELVNIKISNIDLSHNCILLETTKTDKERFVFFTNETKNDYLIPYLKLCGADSTYLINIKKSSIESVFDRANKHLKFKKFKPHMLRHTYATILINKNTNLFFISKTLGHSSLAVTKKYLHATQEQLFNTYKEQFNYD